MARILYAEDNALLRISAQVMLENRGHEVTAAEDGIGAIDALRKEIFDVLLTDNNMPRASGLEVIAAAQKLQQLPKVTILYTGDNIKVAPEGVRVLFKGEHDISGVCKIIHQQLGLAVHPFDL